MMTYRGRTLWIVPLLVGLAMTAAADDRDFLRIRSAAPNILFILDSSTSMIGTSEAVENGPYPTVERYVPFGLLPGAGDDPESRMGIAKRVLREFLGTITDANFALASYNQEEIAGNPNGHVPIKHWVYEMRGVESGSGTLSLQGDRFGFTAPGYAFRFGENRIWNGDPIVVFDPLAINPGDGSAGWFNDPASIVDDYLYGYNLYFVRDPDDPGYRPIFERYGPEPVVLTDIDGDGEGVDFDNDGVVDFIDDDGDLANDNIYDDPVHPFNLTHWYDLMPHYFGQCVPDPAAVGGYTCLYGVYPVKTRGSVLGDGTLDLDRDSWTYGFSRCAPGTPPTGSTDDGCASAWEVQVNATTIREWRRRARLEMAPGYAPRSVDTIPPTPPTRTSSRTTWSSIPASTTMTSTRPPRMPTWTATRPSTG
jgi:hypothetical protein